jgi:hypothetical protein
MSTITMAPTAPMRVKTPSVRLTRRGRLVVFTVALLIVLALGVLWGSGSVATENSGTLVVQVEPGDTLYDIAARVTTEGDINATVEEIEDLNRLDSTVVYAGQKLRVPTSG